MHPQSDIVLPVHGRKDLVEKLIETLFAHTENFRLILVDDFSDEETTAYLLGILHFQPQALYVRTGKQSWFTRASNTGLRLVRTSMAVLLNSDCVVDCGWLDELYNVWAEAAASGLNVGMVGSVLSGEEQRRWAEYKEPGYVTGHCLLLSMDLISQIAVKRGTPGWYLDETRQDMIHINSDRFLSYDLNRMGYATVAAFKSAVGHYGGQSWGYNLGRLAQLQVGDPLKGEVIG
jgi:glycosyltransferase involved in cell wall biosynthesis